MAFRFKEECHLRSYIPPLLNSSEHLYECALDKEYFDTCPDTYVDWKLKNDCENGATFRVYSHKKIFKNYFCSICNLEDNIEEAKFPMSSSPYRLNMSLNLTDSIKISLNNWSCCISCSHGVTCNSFNYSPLSEFINLLENSSITLKEFISMDYNNLCGWDTLVCEYTTAALATNTCMVQPPTSSDNTTGKPQVGSKENNAANRNRPNVTGCLLFDPLCKEKISTTAIKLEEVLPINGAFQFCKNESIVNATTGDLYSSIRLSANQIEVGGTYNVTIPVSSFITT